VISPEATGDTEAQSRFEQAHQTGHRSFSDEMQTSAAVTNGSTDNLVGCHAFRFAGSTMYANTASGELRIVTVSSIRIRNMMPRAHRRPKRKAPAAWGLAGRGLVFSRAGEGVAGRGEVLLAGCLRERSVFLAISHRNTEPNAAAGQLAQRDPPCRRDTGRRLAGGATTRDLTTSLGAATERGCDPRPQTVGPSVLAVEHRYATLVRTA
jgi:hypothetical protein